MMYAPGQGYPGFYWHEYGGGGFVPTFGVPLGTASLAERLPGTGSTVERFVGTGAIDPRLTGSADLT